MKWFKIHSPDGLDFTWGGEARLSETTTELITPDGKKLLEVPSDWVKQLGQLESDNLTRRVPSDC